MATYFRLFIKNYLPKNEKVFVFLDPDVICIQDPINEIQDTIKKYTATNQIKVENGNLEILENKPVAFKSKIFKK